MVDALARWISGWTGTPRVVWASNVAPAVGTETRAVLEGAGIELVICRLQDSSGQLTPEAANAEVLISSQTRIDGAAFAAMPRARFLLRPYVGYDDIDVAAASEYGILVANVPDTFVEEVANHTLALLLSANRRLLQMDQFVRVGRWAAGERPREVAHPIRRLSTMTLGLVGFGTIARLVASRAAPFGFRLLACDPYVTAATAAEHGVTLVSQEELLRESDIVSLHVFLSRQTRHLIGAEQLALMKRTAILVNTARGPIVDEAALIEALRRGQIAGAALDVMEQEPLDPASPLVGMDNVILAPHLASYSDEGDALHRQRVGKIVLQVASGGLPERQVVIDKALYDRIAALPELASVRRY